MRFVLDQPGVTAVIPGTKKMKHMEDNIGDADVAQPKQEELTRVEQVLAAMSR